MDAAAVLIATVKLRPGMDAEFTAWKHTAILSSEISRLRRQRHHSANATRQQRMDDHPQFSIQRRPRCLAEIQGTGGNHCRRVPLFEGGNFAKSCKPERAESVPTVM
jgi:hypothetical protein